jgi:hypothetical protein
MIDKVQTKVRQQFSKPVSLSCRVFARHQNRMRSYLRMLPMYAVCQQTTKGWHIAVDQVITSSGLGTTLEN